MRNSIDHANSSITNVMNLILRLTELVVSVGWKNAVFCHRRLKALKLKLPYTLQNNVTWLLK
jgi:hypothetical protein